MHYGSVMNARPLHLSVDLPRCLHFRVNNVRAFNTVWKRQRLGSLSMDASLNMQVPVCQLYESHLLPISHTYVTQVSAICH